MSRVDEVFSRLMTKVEEMTVDDLKSQLGKHSGGGPTVDDFLSASLDDHIVDGKTKIDILDEKIK